MDTPVKTAMVLIAYLLSIFVIKKLMEKRKALELKGFLCVYNALQVLASLYITVEVKTKKKQKRQKEKFR